jgi:hypothetical protein
MSRIISDSHGVDFKFSRCVSGRGNMINVSFIGGETGVMKKKKDKLRDEHSYSSHSF